MVENGLSKSFKGPVERCMSCLIPIPEIDSKEWLSSELWEAVRKLGLFWILHQMQIPSLLIQTGARKHTPTFFFSQGFSRALRLMDVNAKNGCSFFAYNWSFFAYSWSSFAYSGKVYLRSASMDCKQRSSTVSNNAPTVSK